MALDAIVLARHVETKNSPFTILQYSGFMGNKQTAFLVTSHHAKEAILWSNYMKKMIDGVM